MKTYHVLILGMSLGCVLTSSCASAIIYPYYVTWPAKDKLLNYTDNKRDKTKDLALSTTCNPDAKDIHAKCITVLFDTYFEQVTENLQCRQKLIDCQKGQQPTP